MSLSTVMPGRHSFSGLRLITVSNISVGAGSVAVDALPALPHTEATSGKVLMILFWVCTSSAALVTERPGSVVGMKNRVPSFKVGMNSEPSRIAGQAEPARIATASRMVVHLKRSAARITGR